MYQNVVLQFYLCHFFSWDQHLVVTKIIIRGTQFCTFLLSERDKLGLTTCAPGNIVGLCCIMAPGGLPRYTTRKSRGRQSTSELADASVGDRDGNAAASTEVVVESMGVSVGALHRLDAGPPQFIRITGFRSVFEKYYDRLDQAVCIFGSNIEVRCRCNTLLGTIECDFPRSRSSTVVQRDDELMVRFRIADFESPPFAFRYAADTGGSRSSKKHSRSSSNIEEDLDTAGTTTRSTRQTRALQWIRRDRASKKGGAMYSLVHECIAEFVGTMFIVLFGVGSVCTAILFQPGIALWHITVLWGFGVAFAILVSASISGAHLNPAVSLGFALFRPHIFPLKKLLPFWMAQYLGGIIGGALNLMLFGPGFKYYEAENNIQRGEDTGVITASGFGEYFPAPLASLPSTVVSPGFALLVEAFGTSILMFMILALTDPRQKFLKNKEMFAFYIGFTVAVLMTLYGPLTQVGMNPARDFGPRIVAAMAGWGHIAIPGPRHGFWVYIIGPKIGAPVGAFLYDFLIYPGLST